MNHIGAEFRVVRTVFGHKNAISKPFSLTTLHRFGSWSFTPEAVFYGTILENVKVSRFAFFCDDSNSSNNKSDSKGSFVSFSGHGVSNIQKNPFTVSYRSLHYDLGRLQKTVVGLGHPLALTRLSSGLIRKDGVRTYSTNNHEGGNEPRTEIKGVVVHIPNPIDWLKNFWYLFVVQGLLDSSFNRQEFLFGAKQAVCHLTRLAVLQDFDSMKFVASAEVVNRMKEIISALSLEQLHSIEILPENINLARLSVSSIRYEGEGCYAVSIDVFCLAIRMFQSRPLLIQTILRFNRDYEPENRSDWHITSIQEFNIKELGSTKAEDEGHPK